MKVLINENRDKYSINYTLEDKEIFSNVEYKVLRNAETDGFIKCVKISHNGKLKLVYDISPYRDLLSLTREMSLNSFITVVSRLLTIVINVGENGFMQYKNIDPSINNIYVDTNNLKVYMIYLPLQYEGNDSEEIFVREFKNNIIQAINLNRNFYGETITILRNNLISDKSLAIILQELNNKNLAEKAKRTPMNAIPERVKPDNLAPKKVAPKNVIQENVAPVPVPMPVKVNPAKVVADNVSLTPVKAMPKKMVTANEMPKKVAPKKVNPEKRIAPTNLDDRNEEQNKNKGKSFIGSIDKFFSKALEHAQMDIVEDYYGDSQSALVKEKNGSKIVTKQEVQDNKRASSLSSISSISNPADTATAFMKALEVSGMKMPDNTYSSSVTYSSQVLSTSQISTQVVPSNKQINNHNNNEKQSYKNDGSRALVLKGVNTPVPLSFVIAKKEYAIGSNKYMVDGVIDNKAVSRLHCIVTVKNDGYFIQDVDSKNGTYVNSLRLQKNVLTRINVGDKVSVANCDFMVKEIEI